MLTYGLGLYNTEYNRAKLANVLLNYSSEKGTDVNPDLLKALVSGEPVQAREPYGKPFTIYNTVRFIVNANELPKETEQNEAYFRRFLIVPFDVTITDDQKDTDLAKKIIADELPGVFNWLLQGLERINIQRKFTLSDKVQRALEAFKKQTDSVQLFLEEYPYRKSSKKTPAAEIYREYKSFCQEDGYRTLGKVKFLARFERLGFEKTRAGDGSTAFLAERDFNLKI